MKSLCMVSVSLVFTLACAGTGPAARREHGEVGQKRLPGIKKKPSVAPTTTIAGQEGTKRDRTLAAKEQSDKEAGGKQKSARGEKSATQELLRELIAIVEEEKATATKDEMAAEDEVMLEITGLIMEETMTKIGYDFYEYFFLFWEAPQGISVEDYNILISEKASPMWGSWVRVDVDETTVWSRVLRPRSEEIEDAVKEAIGTTQQYLHNYEQYQFKSKDMVGSDI